MENVYLARYEADGSSVVPNEQGMRPMQVRAFAESKQKYLLIKAPPASGKSRALMFIALEKLKSHLVKKVIVAVPERSIAKSFADTNLESFGFHSNWVVNPKFDLCSPGGEKGKIQRFVEFLASDETILLCTHSTLRFGFEQADIEAFNDVLIAIDEFHHVSVHEDNRLGQFLRAVMDKSSAQVLAMTGSYFRGDANAILSSEDEVRFAKVTYNYFEQLNGYAHLKTLGIAFSFYHGPYTLAIAEVLDTTKKTIIHIPSVNSGESLKEKYFEVDQILDSIGDYQGTTDAGIVSVKTKDGRIIRIADLVNDEPATREKVVTFLRNLKKASDVDIIIALGMAKEGFDWPYCEVALTVGYRGSLTEIIQIIGRTTRDSVNKTHAQFINLVAEPDESRANVSTSVNNIFKAIAASLLMEDVLAPRLKLGGAKAAGDHEMIFIRGFKDPTTVRVQQIVKDDYIDLKAKILQSAEIQTCLGGGVDPYLINNVLIPKIIRQSYPDLDDDEVDSVADHVIAGSALNGAQRISQGGRQLIQLANSFVNVDELNIDLIYQINPFASAYQIVSKELDAATLKAIQDYIVASRIDVTDDEAMRLWPEVERFYQNHGQEPLKDSLDPHEKRLAEVLAYLRRVKNESRP
jgi:superfamily II DNA or RNA helicase